MNTFDNLITQQCSDDKVWVGAFMWMVLDVLTHPKTFVDQIIFKMDFFNLPDCYFITCESQTFFHLLNLKVTLPAL